MYILLVEWRAGGRHRRGPALPIPGRRVGKIDRISCATKIWRRRLERNRGNGCSPSHRAAPVSRVNHLLATRKICRGYKNHHLENQRQARGVTLADYGGRARPHRVRRRRPAGQPPWISATFRRCRMPLYIRFDLQSDVVATATSLLGVIPRVLDDLRDRRLVAGVPPPSIMEIKPAQGLIKLVRIANGSFGAIAARAEQQKVMQYLEQICSLRIAQFVSETMADQWPTASEDEASLR